MCRVKYWWDSRLLISVLFDGYACRLYERRKFVKVTRYFEGWKFVNRFVLALE